MTRSTRERQDRLIQERVHDTYKLRGKLSEPTRCPQCGAVYHNGHRTNDNYPAGELTLLGGFVKGHRNEITGLAHNIEATEKSEHPMNRIIAVRSQDDSLLITTTDVHLPRRIAKAIQDAYDGELDIHFDNEGYFISIVWRRDE